jgi:photosystem II stability/assembly factor-like uncharacterized protein
MNTRFFYSILSFFILYSCSIDNNNSNSEPIAELSLNNLIDLNSNIPQDFYNDLTFTNENTGYAVSRLGRIIKTIDGGANWTTYEITGNIYLKKIQFVNQNVGYVIGGDDTGSYIFKTTNAGATWTTINLNSEITGFPNSLYFKNVNEGYVLGNHLFKKTIDGGLNWINVFTTTDENYQDIKFDHSNSIGYVTLNNGNYYKTSNGGQSWQTIDFDVSVNNFKEIYFVCDKVMFKNNNFVTNLEDNRSTEIPAPASKLLYLNTSKCIGIGKHYENGFFPSGDILLTNDNWTTFLQKSYQPSSEAMDFTAIAKMNNHKIMILGTGQLGTKIVVLNY